MQDALVSSAAHVQNALVSSAAHVQDASESCLLWIQGRGGKTLVKIGKDGEVIYGPEYHPDETARVLWSTVAAMGVDLTAIERARRIESETALAGERTRRHLAEERLARLRDALAEIGLARTPEQDD